MHWQQTSPLWTIPCISVRRGHSLGDCDKLSKVSGCPATRLLRTTTLLGGGAPRQEPLVIATELRDPTARTRKQPAGVQERQAAAELHVGRRSTNARAAGAWWEWWTLMRLGHALAPPPQRREANASFASSGMCNCFSARRRTSRMTAKLASGFAALRLGS